MTVNSPSGSRLTLQRDTWLWDDMSLNSPGGSTLQRINMWLWNHDSEFAPWQHPAMWHVALRSWHWIRQVAAPGYGMPCHWIRPNVRRIGILHLFSISTIGLYHRSRHVIPHESAKFYLNRTILSRKKMTSCRFSRWRISAIFRGPIMGSLKSPYTTSYRSSVETIALSCLVFEKIAFFAFWR